MNIDGENVVVIIYIGPSGIQECILNCANPSGPFY